ncbi:MAG: hypothetical protein GX166_12840 [Clostridiaceae bacterium]|nr:hypothetical protein [Clostridiaceae bacterium]
MKKSMLFLLVIIFLQIAVSAETVLFEDDLNAGTLSQTEFFTYFGMYNANENNYVFDGENGYYHGKWTEGASAFYYDLLEDYTLYVDFSTNGTTDRPKNAYRSFIAIRVAETSKDFVFEPDNGQDQEAFAFLGVTGIYFYCYENYVEVGVHTNKSGGTAGPVNAPEGYGAVGEVEDAEKRDFGVYSISAFFELPEGKTFNDFVSVKIVDEKEKVFFYAEDTLICEIALADVENVVVKLGPNYWNESRRGEEIVSEDCYRTVVIKDAVGNEVVKVEGAVVPLSGLFGFGNRANAFKVDNVKVALNYDVTPAPTKEKTETPVAETTPSTTPTAQEEDKTGAASSVGILPIVLVALSVLLIGGIVLILIMTSKKNKG